MAKAISRRNFLQLSGAVAAVGVLAACAPAAAPTTGGEGGGDTAAATKALVWDTFRGPGTGWNEERIETFQAEYSDVTVEFRPLTGSSQQDNYGKMYAMHAAGDLGDIVAFDPSHFHFWRAINAEIIQPIQDLADADSTDLTQWYDRFMSLQYYQGTLYGLPSWGWAGYDTLVTNAVQFREAGLELPEPTGHDTSMDQIGEWARALYSEGERFGLAVSASEAFFTVLCRCFDSYLINEDGTQSLIMEDTNAQEALRWVYDLGVTDKVLPAPGAVENLPSAQLEGRITMNWGGSLNVRNYDRDLQDESAHEAWQILFPTREDGRFPSQLRGGTWNIRTGTEYPTEAFNFLKHITNEEGCYSFNIVAGQGALVRPDVMQRLIEDNPIHEWFLSDLENGIPAHAPANSRGREYTDAVAQYGALLLDPNQPVEFEQGIQDMHDNIQAVLDMEPA